MIFDLLFVFEWNEVQKPGDQGYWAMYGSHFKKVGT